MVRAVLFSFLTFSYLAGIPFASAQIPGQTNPNTGLTTGTPTNNNAIGANSMNVGAGPYTVGSAVMVKWHGSWWPAHVLQVAPKKWFIHYDGYNSSWDEWVGPSRIRPR